MLASGVAALSLDGTLSCREDAGVPTVIQSFAGRTADDHQSQEHSPQKHPGWEFLRGQFPESPADHPSTSPWGIRDAAHDRDEMSQKYVAGSGNWWRRESDRLRETRNYPPECREDWSYLLYWSFTGGGQMVSIEESGSACLNKGSESILRAR